MLGLSRLRRRNGQPRVRGALLVVAAGASASAALAAVAPVSAGAASQPAAAGVPLITTEAGGPGTGPATSLAISAFDLAVSGSSILVADNGHNVVRAIDTRTGQATVLAGDGLAGARGKGGAATGAELNAPTGVARSATGVVYVADGNRVRAIGTDGRIRNVAGTQQAGFSGDGGPAARARLNSVFGLAVDPAGNLYIADGGNHRIRMIDAATRHIRTIAGNGSGIASGDGGPALQAGMTPLNLLVTPSGAVLFTDFLNNRVREISPKGTVSTIAGTGGGGFSGDGGPATRAQIATPHGLALGADGSIYVTDNGNMRVRKISPQGAISTVAGTGSFLASGDGGPAVRAGLADPFGLAMDASGALYIAEIDGVRRVGSNGVITRLAGNGGFTYGGDGGAAPAAQLSDPQGIAADPAGDVYVADDLNCRIRRIEHGTGIITTVAGTGECGFSGDGGPASAAELNRPRAVALDPAGDLYIADTNNLRIRKVDARSGRISTIAGTGVPGRSGDGGPATAAQIDYTYGIAVSPSGDVAISQYTDHTVRVIDGRSGRIRTVAGTGHVRPLGDGWLAVNAALDWPLGVAYDRAGNLFIADTGHFRIRRVDAHTARISTVAGTGRRGFSGDGGPALAAALHGLNGLAVAPDGTIYLSDGLNHRVRRIRGGVITTLAGSGSPRFWGDGGPATAAGLPDPRGLALDGSGVLHIADGASQRVRAVTGLG